MLCADPNTRESRRFLTSPPQCEVTGVITTPDCKTMFLGIQHPGEEALTDQCLREIRALTYLLHPPLLEHGGLAYALPWLARNLTERSGMRIETHLDGEVGRFTAEIESCFFRVAQEALQNSVAHSGGASAVIHLSRGDSTLRLTVRDNGGGFRGSGFAPAVGRGEQDAGSGGIGLISMRERMDRIGGHLVIESSAAGTLIRAEKALAPQDYLRAEIDLRDKAASSGGVPASPRSGVAPG